MNQIEVELDNYGTKAQNFVFCCNIFALIFISNIPCNPRPGVRCLVCSKALTTACPFKRLVMESIYQG